MTIDEWESRAVYEEIRPKFAKEYAELDWTCEGMTTREKHLYSLRLELQESGSTFTLICDSRMNICNAGLLFRLTLTLAAPEHPEAALLTSNRQQGYCLNFWIAHS